VRAPRPIRRAGRYAVRHPAWVAAWSVIPYPAKRSKPKGRRPAARRQAKPQRGAAARPLSAAAIAYQERLYGEVIRQAEKMNARNAK
jgi:hypothetical protein